MSKARGRRGSNRCWLRNLEGGQTEWSKVNLFAPLRCTLDLTAGLMATQQHGRHEDGGVRGRHDQRFKAPTSRTARNCAPARRGGFWECWRSRSSGWGCWGGSQKPAIDSGNLSDEIEGAAKIEDEIAWGGVGHAVPVEVTAVNGLTNISNVFK
ncbi:hypothetical protein K438DRAFT_1772185 [Mycena galopus ATCC 62051]|nr:hypothetical protein K438DRAFT_1772185 [Mycena galopus ATCC 62051]